MRGVLRAPHVRGFVPLPTGTDRDSLMVHILADLRTRECQVRVTDADELVVEQGTPGRGSVLAFVDDGGTIRLDRSSGVLTYDFSTAGGLLLCGILSPVCGGFAWFGLDGDPMLTTFALVMPVLWLYGANYALSCARVPAFLAGLCQTAPGRPAGPVSPRESGRA